MDEPECPEVDDALTNALGNGLYPVGHVEFLVNVFQVRSNRRLERPSTPAASLLLSPLAIICAPLHDSLKASPPGLSPS